MNWGRRVGGEILGAAKGVKAISGKGRGLGTDWSILGVHPHGDSVSDGGRRLEPFLHVLPQ